jgi:Protein of unknown function (DUF3089)
VWAPVYRQFTTAAETRWLGGTLSNAGYYRVLAKGYRDVLSAWLDYLARDNHGRGIVLIGDSQGAADLIRLIQSQIDPHPERRRRLVAAILLGANVIVRAGSSAGGDFQHVPACRQTSQTRCVSPTRASTSHRAPTATTACPRRCVRRTRVQQGHAHAPV